MKTIKSTIKKFEKENFNNGNILNKFIYDIEDLEENPKLLDKLIQQSLKEIEEGKTMPLKQFMAEMEAKYHING